MNLGPGSIIINLVFGAVGFVAFVYGKKESLWKPMVIGIALCVFPYFIPGLWAQAAVGAALIAALWIFRE